MSKPAFYRLTTDEPPPVLVRILAWVIIWAVVWALVAAAVFGLFLAMGGDA